MSILKEDIGLELDLRDTFVSWGFNRYSMHDTVDYTYPFLIKDHTLRVKIRKDGMAIAYVENNATKSAKLGGCWSSDPFVVLEEFCGILGIKKDVILSPYNIADAYYKDTLCTDEAVNREWLLNRGFIETTRVGIHDARFFWPKPLHGYDIYIYHAKAGTWSGLAVSTASQDSSAPITYLRPSEITNQKFTSKAAVLTMCRLLGVAPDPIMEAKC